MSLRRLLPFPIWPKLLLLVSLLLLGIARAALADAAMADETPIIASVTRLRGEAAVEGGEGKREGGRALALGSPLVLGDVLVTGADGRLEITFIDGTLVTLGEQARLTIDQWLYDPASQKGRGLLSVASGAFRVVTGGLGRQADHSFAVRTPYATIGIRGTDFWGGPLDDPFNVLLLQGRVVLTTPDGEVELTPGLGTEIRAMGRAPEAPHVWSAERVQRAIATVTF